MAGRGRPSKNKVENVKENVDLNLQKENEQLKKENEEIKNEFKSLSSMFNEMMKEFKEIKESKKEEVSEAKPIKQIEPNNPNNKFQEFEDIGPRYRAYVTSLYHGGLNLRGLNKDVRFENFGHTRACNFEDIEEFARNNGSFLKQGLFFIHDDRVVKLIYVDDEYHKVVEPDLLKKIFELPVEEIKRIYNSTTKALQKEIMYVFVDWINKNDPYYLDKNKIDIINQLSGKDVREVAEQLKSYREE